jgi:hypothetical protein
MRAYSLDLRRKIVESVKKGVSKSEIACRFGGGKETLIEALGRALGAVRTEDVRGFFAYCGYRAAAQPL